jgi:hypothetical protein
LGPHKKVEKKLEYCQFVFLSIFFAFKVG